ncbi:unnamed protein product [Echinostoma caproni]|uniref:Glycogen debranching enzyme n=1 Tax=Echinostoma caproni TaxID=27848 RepID=A0A183AWV6_9TREM|nr:unnamed protein product [Echinostoma caproni]
MALVTPTNILIRGSRVHVQHEIQLGVHAAGDICFMSYDFPFHLFDKLFSGFVSWLSRDLNCSQVPFSDQQNWGQLPKEPSAELDKPKIVLTADSGQHKLLISTNTSVAAPHGQTLSTGSWINNENRMSLSLPPAFRALDVENCG